jgi:hypothetical protein
LCMARGQEGVYSHNHTQPLVTPPPTLPMHAHMCMVIFSPMGGLTAGNPWAVSLDGQPENYRPFVVMAAPGLQRLDDREVTGEERAEVQTRLDQLPEPQRAVTRDAVKWEALRDKALASLTQASGSRGSGSGARGDAQGAASSTTSSARGNAGTGSAVVEPVAAPLPSHVQGKRHGNSGDAQSVVSTPAVSRTSGTVAAVQSRVHGGGDGVELLLHPRLGGAAAPDSGVPLDQRPRDPTVLPLATPGDSR